MQKYKSFNTSAKGKKASRKKPIILVLLGLVVLLGLLLVLDRKDIINLPFLSKDKPAATPTGINYNPPTQQEKAETEKFKENLGNQSKEDTPATPTPTTPTGKKSVSPVMTSWGASPNVEARGYVPGVNEEGGTCTLTLTRNGQTVTESKTGISDVKTVSCGLISVSRTRLSTGTWNVTLSYSSASSEGVSTSNQVEVE